MSTTSVILVLEDDVLNVSATDYKRIGLKAVGLCSLPSVWTKPFFVVSGERNPSQRALDAAFKEMNMGGIELVIIRSSGIDESIEDRGSLTSKCCARSDILTIIHGLVGSLPLGYEGKVHWVIQELISTKIKGHLSNERRVSEAARDWVVEYEASNISEGEIYNISLRLWRDSTKGNIEELICQYKQSITEVLKNICKWTNEKKKRIHYEWVWDGKRLFIVQADEANIIKKGDDPYKLLDAVIKKPLLNNVASQLKIFRAAEENDFVNYRKLRNVSVYQKIGYSGYRFYILDSKSIFSNLFFDNVFLCEDLLADLEILTSMPLVLRTDGLNIPKEKFQMLPRSDELKNIAEAKEWLKTKFRQDIFDSNLQDCDLCLVAHHFIPALSSAWAQAAPNERMVRIESLWGLPDGVNWYSHDVFDIDTAEFFVPDEKNPSSKVSIYKKRKRYKDYFIAPDSNGDWKVHRTDEHHCWSSSINDEWIKEIAWNSRRIAQEVGGKIIIMWFVGIPGSFSVDTILPWYHEKDVSDQLNTPIKAPRKHILAHDKYTIRTVDDWERIKNECSSNNVAYVRIKPKQPELVRNQKFAKDLAEYSSAYNFIILLSGGLLSHVYYVLNNYKAKVECEDLYESPVEELEFNKLVRDKIPSKIEKHGETVSLCKLKNEALQLLTRRKIVEECFEVKGAETIDHIAEEIADVQEVLEALCCQQGILLRPSQGLRDFSISDASISCDGDINKSNVTLNFPVYLADRKLSRIISLRNKQDKKRIFKVDILIHRSGGIIGLSVYISEMLSDMNFDINDDGDSSCSLVDRLKNNILVSAYKVLDASDGHLCEDVSELFSQINILAKELDIDPDRIVSIKNKKLEKAGGFSNGLMLIKTLLPPSLVYRKASNNLPLFEIDHNDNVISDVTYLPSISCNVYPDRRRQDNSPDILQFRFELPIYEIRALELYKEYKIDANMKLSFYVRRSLSMIECIMSFEVESGNQQLVLI